MKQYNHIMLGEGRKYIQDCLKNDYIGAYFIKHVNLTSRSTHNENKWHYDLTLYSIICKFQQSVLIRRNSTDY